MVGFRVIDCSSSSRCTVDIAARVDLPDGSEVITVGGATMLWHDGDWLTYQPVQAPTPRYIAEQQLQAVTTIIPIQRFTVVIVL